MNALEELTRLVEKNKRRKQMEKRVKENPEPSCCAGVPLNKEGRCPCCGGKL